MAGYTYSSLPRVNILGIKDESVVAIPVQQEALNRQSTMMSSIY